MRYPGYTVIDGSGNIETSWFDQLWIPNQTRGPSKCGVILLHGANTNPTIGAQWTLDGWHHLSKLAAVLANAGIPCIAGHMGGNNFSNDAVCGTASTAYINKAGAYMAAQTGCSASKFHVFGVSMGGGNGPRWAGLNPSKAASVAGIIPNVSIQHLYTDNPNNTVGQATQGFSEMIAAAWGLTSRVISDAVITSGGTSLSSASGAFTSADTNRVGVGDNLTAGQKGIQAGTTLTFVDSAHVTLSKPALTTATAQKLFIGDQLPMSGASGADIIGYSAPILASNNIPTRVYYANDDPYIYAADVTAFATAAGGTAINLGAGGHADATAANMDAYHGTDFADYLAWLIANGA